MDWDNDYHTFSDTNISYIWGFLKAVHERGWLYTGHRATEWCPRCGTSISQHELFAGEYKELEHPSLYVRFPLKEREDEALVVWTTTPWTLPANVAAAVKPDAEYGLRDGQWRLAHEGEDYDRTVKGEELVGLEYDGAVRRRAGAGRDRPSRHPMGRGRRSTRAPGSSTSPRARARRTSTSHASTGSTCSSRSTSRGGCCPGSGRPRGSPRTRPPT